MIERATDWLAFGDRGEKRVAEVIHSRYPFRGRIVNIRIDELRFEDDRTVQMEVVEHGASVGIVPMHEDGRVVLIRQYRHPPGERLLEIPAGSVEAEEDPEACAQRELAEEIGYRAGTIVRLGGFYLSPGYATEFMTIFLARDLQPADGTPDEDERIDLEELPLAEALRLAHAGELRDAKTIAALALAAAYLAHG
jgi:ADP-ribose pyrophosphatase